MIVVELNIFSLRKSVDLWLDEHLTPYEILEEITCYFDFDVSRSYLASIEEQKILNNKIIISNQGIQGGETLILIEDSA